MTTSSNSRTLTLADRTISSLQRSIAHAESEYLVPFDIEAVMATVSKPEEFEWAQSLVWVAPRIGDDKKLFLQVATDTDGVREHYKWVQQGGERDRYALNARLATEWWALWDAAWQGVSPWTGERVETQAFSLHFTDGSGICAELTSMPLAAPEHQTHLEREALFKSYFDFVRAGDIDAIVNLFTADEYVGSAVRDYLGQTVSGLLELQSLDALRKHYQDFYATFTVDGVDIMNWYVRDWYLFVEARWRVRTKDGEPRGMVTAEVIMLGSDGAISGRLGYGTPLESDV